uniref:Pecanex-like protein n=1 Tax=Panagrellus redivivus TaxID=6233 RepID=A0A7E4UZK7_PANRE
MTIGNHVAEIARQGIWASLTGGWCYEPANTIFCNTVHLYTWAVLMLAPLLIGIFTAGTFSWWILGGYVCFVVVLFSLLKLIISYLHRVFDTTEPIIKYKQPKRDSVPIEAGGEPVASSEDEMTAELRGMNMIPLSEYRHCTVIERDSPIRTDPPLGEGPFGNLKSIHEDDSCSSSSSKASNSALLESKKSLKRITAESEFILPADSFELLPIPRRASANTDLNSSSPSPVLTAANRKSSEPNFESCTSRTRNATGSSSARRRDSTPNASLRRGHSNSTDASRQYQRRLSAYYHHDSKRRRGVSPAKSKSEGPAEVFIEDDQQPCCSKDIVPRRSQRVEPDPDVPSSSTAMVPFSRRRQQEEAESSFNEPTSSEVALPINGEDLKGKITQFLEELIDKHPETLDVIESVRQSRLGRGGTAEGATDRPGPSSTMPSTTVTSTTAGMPGSSSSRSSRHRGSSTLPSGVSFNASLRDGTHVAYDHEDTTEGAVHSFQDEHGTWWTYTFRDGGPGVAHPLGSTRAIYELFSQRNDPPPAAVSSDLHRSTHRRHASAAGALPSASGEDGASTSARWYYPSSRRSESIATDKPYSSVTYVDSRNEESLPDPLGVALPLPSEVVELRRERSKRRRRRARGPRTHSNSSDEASANDYISNLPTNVFHANASGTNSGASQQPVDTLSIHRQFMSIAHLASRLYPHYTGTVHHPATSTPAGTHSAMPVSARTRTALESFADDRRRRVYAGMSSDSDRNEYTPREYTTLEVNEADTRALTMRILNDLNPLGQSNSLRWTPRQSRAPKANHYYRLKPFSLGQGFQIKFDRLSVAALFDRNKSVFSCFFDVFLSAAITVLAALLISRGIFADLSLVFFAIVVAGAQFSLLKSVQPDASSPVHGFNWLVTYSRPAYFCFLGTIVLLLDLYAVDFIWDASTASLPTWNWNLYTLKTASPSAILIGFRDFLTIMLLCLPLAHTIGLLPSITTLFMHVMEQVDVHLFGATASFSLFSAAMAISRSILTIAALTVLGHFTWLFDPVTTQNAVFAAFTAVTISTAFLMSRWSTNPFFLTVVFNGIKACFSFRCSSESPAAEVESASTHSKSATNIEDLPKLRMDPVMESIKKEDPMPKMLKETLIARMHNDVFYAVVNSLIVFALHCTSIFTTTQPYFELVITSMCIFFGFMNHYVYSQLRCHLPWKIFEKPLLKPHEYHQFEVTTEAKIMVFEKVHVWAVLLEKNILYPLLISSYLTSYAWKFPIATAPLVAVFVTVLCGFRLSRAAYCHPQLLYFPLVGAFALANFGYGIFLPLHLRQPIPVGAEYSFLTDPSIYISPLITFYVFVTIWPKIQEFTLKLNFVLAYIAPWQISWGSAFHAFAQPFSLPHSGMILIQTILSSIISAPLNPFLGSSFFLMSYVRPIKFWEKDYNTKHADPFNVRLINQLERGPMMDDSNFNAIFYEHLTRSLQQYLAGDLCFGRWATSINPGDCFVLASTNFNCLVHIVEVGNGFATFQLRGLEFRGTYCHQREIEAITEDSSDSGSFCCCSIAKIPGLLSFNTMFAVRWLAWEVTTAKYLIEGYSISDNSAVNILQVYELRRLLVTLYVKCIVFYMITAPNFDKWLNDETIQKVLEPILANPRYVEIDQMFSAANDEDYDINVLGVTRQGFAEVHGRWIRHCYERRLADRPTETARENNLVVSFCFLMSVLGRRSVGAQAYNRHANAAEAYLYGLHAIFKGDLRVTCGQDEWVLCDPEILLNVITPAVKMAIKLHQDHFAASEDLENPSSLYEKIEEYHLTLFISHEHDPTWRQAIISNTPSLLALRHMYDDGQDDYKVIMLNRSNVNMRVIKLNKECVRAFWAGQQQELIFLRNRNPERGSIQNARQVLRNMINSSADQPIGYPIYVSPLMTSFIDNHPHIERVVGASVNFCTIASAVRHAFGRLVRHFGTSGSSNLPAGGTGSGNTTREILPMNVIGPTLAQAGSTPAPYRKRTATGSVGAASAMGLAGSITAERGPVEDGASLKTSASATVSAGPPEVVSKASASLKRQKRRDSADENPSVDLDPLGVLKQPSEPLIMAQTSVWSDTLGHEMFVEIVDKAAIFSRLNEPHRSTNETLVQWPCEAWRKSGGRAAWSVPIENGLQASVAHVWRPFQANRAYRSHAGVIYLLRVTSPTSTHAPLFVPINEAGIKFIEKSDFFAAIAAETAAVEAETPKAEGASTPVDEDSVISPPNPTSVNDLD